MRKFTVAHHSPIFHRHLVWFIRCSFMTFVIWMEGWSAFNYDWCLTFDNHGKYDLISVRWISRLCFWFRNLKTFLLHLYCLEFPSNWAFLLLLPPTWDIFLKLVDDCCLLQRTKIPQNQQEYNFVLVRKNFQFFFCFAVYLGFLGIRKSS